VIVNVIAASLSSAPSLFEYNAGHLKNTNLNPVFYSLEEWAFRVQSFLQPFFLLSSSYPFFNLAFFSNMIVAGILPLINLVLFIYWIPLLLCLLGVRYPRDLF
jgi:lipopolysaccharide transport system permease protein